MNMEALVIEPKTKEDARFLRNFPKRTGADVIDPVNSLVDMAMRRLKEEEDLLDADVNESKLINSLTKFARQHGFSAHVIDVDEFIEEYEDMVLVQIMEERINDPDNGRVSMEEIRKVLRS